MLFLADPDLYLLDVRTKATSRLTVDFSLPGQPGYETSTKILAEYGNGAGYSQLDKLRATRITNRRFTPPADFDLTAFWEEHVRGS